MPTTEHTARPDLSSLDWHTRANSVLAEVVDGATWIADDWGVWHLVTPAENVAAVLAFGGTELVRFRDFRDYLNDPAAAWSLMVRETSGVKFDSPDAVGLLWRVRSDDALILDEMPVPIIAGRDRAARRAVVLTALRKHAEGPFAELIRPLLEEVGHG